MKICAKCKEEKPLDRFTFIKSKGKYHSYCKPCRVTYNSSVCTRTPEEKVAASRKSKLKKNYGITPEEYDLQYRSQRGLCLICSTALQEQDPHYVHVDHNHTTGKPRGILCGRCNHGLGHFLDSVEIMKKAIEYVKNDGEWNV